MKTTQKLLLSLSVLTMFGCGGSNSSFAKNPFGEIPKIVVKFQTETPSLAGLKKKDITPEMVKEVHEKALEFAKQMKEEASKIIGNKVPFSGDPFKLLQIEDVVISNAKTNAVDCNVEIKVLCKPKKEITLTDSPKTGSYDKFTFDGESEADATCSLYAIQYAVFIDNAGGIIDYKKFRPFDSDKYSFQYTVGSKINPSQYCNDKGSTLHIQLIKMNFADFKEICFMTEDEFKKLASKAK